VKGAYHLAVTKAKSKKAHLDVNQNVTRIFGEMIARSEEAPKRGSLKIAPPPAKKNGATKQRG
jgi:hypothetical protein